MSSAQRDRCRADGRGGCSYKLCRRLKNRTACAVLNLVLVLVLVGSFFGWLGSTGLYDSNFFKFDGTFEVFGETRHDWNEYLAFCAFFYFGGLARSGCLLFFVWPLLGTRLYSESYDRPRAASRTKVSPADAAAEEKLDISRPVQFFMLATYGACEGALYAMFGIGLGAAAFVFSTAAGFATGFVLGAAVYLFWTNFKDE